VRRPPRLHLAPLALAVSACGFGLADDSSGGRDDLPLSGAGPFKKLAFDGDTPLEEPWLATDPVFEFTEPALMPRAGGGLTAYVTRESAAEPAGDTSIWRLEQAAIDQLPDAAVEVLVADRTWEEGHVGAPAIVAEGDTLVMFYAGGTGIGRADSTDGGLTWTKWPAPILTDATSPGLAYDGATWLLAFVDGSGGIGLARSTDGHEFTRTAAPIVVPRADDVKAFDHAAVAAPALGWIEEGTGRGHWALWYAGLKKLPVGTDAPLYAIGYAASWDGASWSLLAGNRPVTAAPAGDPAVLLEGNHGVMAFAAVNGRRSAIGLAVTP